MRRACGRDQEQALINREGRTRKVSHLAGGSRDYTRPAMAMPNLTDYVMTPGDVTTLERAAIFNDLLARVLSS